jgi:hypothetical protein
VLTPPSAVPPDTEVSRPGVQSGAQPPVDASRTEPSAQTTPDAPAAPERDEFGNEER